ncbi:DUF3305 domain-containing protein [Vibrio maerlii]|uniref:DUF3305 domain-containing protein n=1 Tax=Vibrio maerlii TaxID=2231648 RepID=UPI000E3DE4D6|nr:DUF3305 domain-containing protein [Vibrio maerlii]
MNSQVEQEQANQEKSDIVWSVGLQLEKQLVSIGKWPTEQWQFSGVELKPEGSDYIETIELHRDERTDYRFNLSSQQPKLFLVVDNFEQGEIANIVILTPSQSVAGQYMDGDYVVLSIDMPLPIQAWMEAFIGRHGELLEVRRKKRRGAGRSSEKKGKYE